MKEWLCRNYTSPLFLHHIHIFCHSHNTMRSCPATKPMHFIVYTYVSTVHKTFAVWQTKCKLVMCSTHVSRVLTVNRGQSKIMCYSVWTCTYQILCFTCSNCAGKHVYRHACIKFKLSRTIVIYNMWLDLRKPSLSAQEMKSILLLIIKPTLLHYLKIPST